MMKLLVTGSRHLQDKEVVWEMLDRLQPTCIVHGGAKGADWWADEWARMNNVECVAYPINTPVGWKLLGRAAGPVRNKVMLHDAQPDKVLAFPLPGSRGTYHMITLAQKMLVSCTVMSSSGE